MNASETTHQERPTRVSERTYAGERVDGRLDTGTLEHAESVLRGEAQGKRRFIRLLPFLGPAFIASIAYVDPGNFATNIEGGAKFGYLLVWVIVAANLMAMVVQALSAKLGIATGQNLAQVIGANFPRPVVIVFWIIAEITAIATDLAEVLGAAVGFYLVFDIPLLAAGLLTGAATFLILGLQSYGFRPLEAVITIFVGVIAACYVLETVLGKPDFDAVASSFLPPRFQGPESVLLAAGILGATVMPHVIYLHSALTQDRVIATDENQRRRLFRFEVIDIVVAMGLAGFINVAMLLMAAVTFHQTGIITSGDDLILRSYETLTPLLGSGASIIFGISLIAAGLSSSTVGTMAGQVIMRGFLGWQIRFGFGAESRLAGSAHHRVGVDTTRTLVIARSFSHSHSVCAGSADRLHVEAFTDGNLVNRRVTAMAAVVIALVIIGLNLFLLHQIVLG